MFAPLFPGVARRGRPDHARHERRARRDLGRPGVRRALPRAAGRRLRHPVGRLGAPRGSHRRRALPGARTRAAAPRRARCAAVCALQASERGDDPGRARLARARCSIPNALTLGFARRVPTYKRLTLLLHERERLVRILNDAERPVQLLVAGKAHPHDGDGKRLIEEFGAFAADHDVRHRVIMLADYDMALAQRARLRRRRVAQHAAAPARGLRHERHEGGAQRRAQPLDPGRLVGRVLRPGVRLGDPVGRRGLARCRRARRARGSLHPRPDRARARPALLRARRRPPPGLARA